MSEYTRLLSKELKNKILTEYDVKPTGFGHFMVMEAPTACYSSAHGCVESQTREIAVCLEGQEQNLVDFFYEKFEKYVEQLWAKENKTAVTFLFYDIGVKFDGREYSCILRSTFM
jgi:hypothetical protein